MEKKDNASFDEVQEKINNTTSLTLSLSTECDSSSFHRNDSLDSEDLSDNDSTNSSFIKDVYSDNLEEAFKEIASIKKKYNYIGMDTEFPGCVYKLKSLTKDFYYKSMKDSVNSTKLIQLGISFTNEKGQFPQKNINITHGNLISNSTKKKTNFLKIVSIY